MKRSKKILYSFLHAIWMIFLVFMWVKQPIILDYEFNIARDFKDLEWALRWGKVKYQEEYKDKFFYINTAHSFKSLESSPSYWPSNVITDPDQLLSLMKQLKENEQNFDIAFLDIFIDEDFGEDNTELKEVVAYLKSKKKLITVNNIDDNYNPFTKTYVSRIFYDFVARKRTWGRNIFGDSLSGSVYYPLSTSQSFYKLSYQLKIGDTLRKQAPLLAYECLSGKKAKKPFLFNLFYKYEGSGKIYQNIFEPKLVITPNELAPETTYDSEGNIAENKTHYEDLRMITDKVDSGAFLRDYLTANPNKIIVIGNLTFGDLHYTLKGQTSGVLLFTNSFITLNESSNKLAISFLIYLLFSFFWVSYFTFFPDFLNKAKQRIHHNNIINFIYQFILKNANYLLLLIATLLGIFVFNQYIFLFFNLIYLFFVTSFIGFIKWRKKR